VLNRFRGEVRCEVGEARVMCGKKRRGGDQGIVTFMTQNLALDRFVYYCISHSMEAT
jgi:hypothetical protein